MKQVIVYIYLLCVVFKFTIAQQNTPAKNSSGPSLANKVSSSTLIVEGHVIEARYYRTSHIYTSAIVRITKLFKGTISDSTIEIVLQTGGEAGGIVELSSRGPHLTTGMEGVFFLKENKTERSFVIDTPSFIIDYGEKGYIEYQPPVLMKDHHVATCKGDTYDDLEKDLFEPIEAITGKPPKVLGLNMFERAAANKAKH